MSKATLRRNITEKNRSPENNSNRSQQSFSLSKHLKKIYPIGLNRSNSALSLSSVSLSLSQTSNDSSNTDYSFSTTSSALEQKISMALRLIAPVNSHERPREFLIPKVVQQPLPAIVSLDEGEPRRCNWITKSSDKAYVSFHDEQWGVPVYDDRKLFELLSMSGMLMDYNWTEILKRQELFSEAFVGFDPNSVAKLEENEIMEITLDKAIMLQEGRIRCIVDNAKCILKIMREFGSFSNYMWSFVNHKPIINRYRHPRNIPLRTPKSEVVSKDLHKRGFRLVGPVIVCSFMQAAGLTIDHLVDCYRYNECVSLAERPWRHL